MERSKGLGADNYFAAPHRYINRLESMGALGMLPNEFRINGRVYTRIVDEVNAERERAEALGGFDAPQFGTRLQDATLDELSAEIERRRKELTAWGKRVDEAAESAPAWVGIGFAPTVTRECCMRDWNKGEQRCADCPDEEFCARTNWDELKDYRETSGDDECCGVFDAPVCDGCPDDDDCDDEEDDDTPFVAPPANAFKRDDFSWVDKGYLGKYGEWSDGLAEGKEHDPLDEVIANENAIEAVVDMLLSRGISADEIIRRLVGAPSIAQSITVNVDGDVTDGSSIAEAFRNLVNKDLGF